MHRWVRAATAALLITVVVAPVAHSRATACSRFGEVAQAGTVQNSGLTEISGLVASRAHPGVYWTHNDSGGKPEVFALRLDGSDLGVYPFDGASATDWEDIGIGPKHGAEGSYLYAADIGDNAASRDHVTIYRAEEPDAEPAAPGHALSGVETIDLTYPGGAEDAEALFVDPVSGDLVIITKSVLGHSRILTAAASALVDGADVTMTDHGTIQIVPPVSTGIGLPGTFVTGADISPDGSLILVRTYRSVLAFDRGSGESVVTALKRSPCNAPQAEETQGEAVAIAADESSYATISEGSGSAINVVPVRSPVPSASSDSVASTTVTTEQLPTTGGSGVSPWWGLVALAVALVIGLRLRAHRTTQAQS